MDCSSAVANHKLCHDAIELKRGIPPKPLNFWPRSSATKKVGWIITGLPTFVAMRTLLPAVEAKPR